jgi:hypothetical protein
MQALETFYNHNRYRSRLEAKWAVYFDRVGVKYQYEPAGFNIGEKCYLPDFYLPEFDAYIEVKPESGDREQVFKDMVAMIETGVSKIGNCLAVFGDPLNHKLMAVGRIDDNQPWKDDFCNQTAIAFDFTDGEKLLSTTFNLSAAEKVSVKLKTTPKALIDNYKEKLYARCVRFEHGEKP